MGPVSSDPAGRRAQPWASAPKPVSPELLSAAVSRLLLPPDRIPPRSPCPSGPSSSLPSTRHMGPQEATAPAACPALWGSGGDLTPQAQSSASAGTTSARQGVPQCPLQAWVRRSHFPGLPKVGGTQLSRRPRATCSLKRLPYVLSPACDRAFPCVSISGPGGGARSHGVVARPLLVDLYPGGLAFPSLKLA